MDLTPIAPRLAPLLGKLASDHDAEVIGAARAAGKLLAKAGLTFTDLGRAIAEPRERVVYVERPPDPPRRDPRPCQRDWRQVAAWCWRRADRLRGGERDFIRQLATGGWRHPRLTEKQAAWLAKICDRLAATEGDPW